MKYYDTFMVTNSSSPSEEIRESLQELVSEEFEVSSSYYSDIYQEKNFGTLDFEKISARIMRIIDSKTGERIDDDYRKIVFPDLSFKPQLGSRYKFDNNIWIVYSVNNIKSTTSSAYLRRCNNAINSIDKYGNVHSEPCIIDYKATKTSTTEKAEMSVPYITQSVSFQLNDWTKIIGINYRLLLEGNPFKVYDRENFNRMETFNNSVKMVKCYVTYDNLNEYDNLSLNIADYKKPDYKIVVQKELKTIVGEMGIIPYKIFLNDSEVEERVIWYSDNNEILSIDKDTGEYTVNEDGNCRIKCSLFENNEYFAIIEVTVSNEIKNVYSNLITPNSNVILLNKTNSYTVQEFLNGKAIDTKFEISVSGMPTNYYSFSTFGNTFSIKNRQTNDSQLLKVRCKNLRDDSIIEKEFELGGIF